MNRQQSSNPKEADMAAKQATQATQAKTTRDVVLHIARIQLASLTAASKFFSGWAQSADRYVQAVSGELCARMQGETESTELAPGSQPSAPSTSTSSRPCPTQLCVSSTRSWPRRTTK